MPNLTAHLDMGLEAARALGCSTVNHHLGSFLLGCTAPDIRVITRGERQDTHFSPLECAVVGEGVGLMLERYPSVADARRLPQATQAFVAGYMLHLVADEAWIVRLYRPFFGNRDVFADHRQGKFLDRALQLELDRRASNEPEVTRAVQHWMATAGDAVQVEFIPAGALLQWRDWVMERVQQPFSWERLRRMVGRAYPADDPEGLEAVEEFLSDVPKRMESIYHRVPHDEVRRFREEVIERFVALAGAYVPCE